MAKELCDGDNEMRYIMVILVVVLSAGPPLALQYTDIPFVFILFLFVLGAISLGILISVDVDNEHDPVELPMTELPRLAREIGEELDKFWESIAEIERLNKLKEKENANEKQNR